ncbi:hypothetical protein [Agrobacterium pusense]|uniref:hypothetical protein n=1 Tax=Agrobacterium pusense TaxID=648995 RepID=UPI000ECE3ADC|nr:hypothetical protein [Agrobacterium sp.]
MTVREQEIRQREKARVARLTDITDRCKGDKWEFDTDGDQKHLIARRSTGERVVIGTLYADALPYEIELILGALENTALFLALRQRAIIALKNGYQQPASRQPEAQLREGDFAANAAMLCAEPLFHRFLERRDQTRAIHNKDHADTVLKKLIGITSKTQLNREERAQAAFIDLRSDFEAWKRGRA